MLNVRLSVVAQAALTLFAASASAALQVRVNGVPVQGPPLGFYPPNSFPLVTSPNAPGAAVLLLSVVETSGAPTAIQAAAIDAQINPNVFPVTGPFLFPDGDPSGGISMSATAAAIARRSVPFGTFLSLPNSISIVEDMDPLPGSLERGFSRRFTAQTFRVEASGPYSTTAADGIIIGAFVVAPNSAGQVTGVVNVGIDTVNNQPFGFNFVITPEPTTLGVVGAIGCLVLARRRVAGRLAS